MALREGELAVLAAGMINLDVVVEEFRPETGHVKDSRVDRISFRTGGDSQNCALTPARGFSLSDRLAFANACGAATVGQVGSNGAEKRAGHVENFSKRHS